MTRKATDSDRELSRWLARSNFRSRATYAARWVKGAPVSLALSLLMIATAVVTVSVGPSIAVYYLAAGTGHPWWTVFTSVLWAKSWLQLLVDVALLLSVGSIFERLLGSGRYLLVGLGSYWSGTFAALGLAYWVEQNEWGWSLALERQDIAGTAVFLAGVVTAASVRINTRWRRRIKVTVVTVLLVMFGFAQSLDAVAALFSASAGLLIGFAIWGRRFERRRLPGTRLEGRVLVALLASGIVLGVLISLDSPQSVGTLTALRYGFIGSTVSAQDVADLCALEGLEGQCAHYTYLLRSKGLGSSLLMLMPLVTQLVLAWGLKAGRRAAMWGTVGLQGMAATIGFIHMVQVEAAAATWKDAAPLLGFTPTGGPTARFLLPIVVPLVLLLVTLGARNLFTVKAAPGTYVTFWTHVFAVTGVSMAVSAGLGVAFRGTLSVGQALEIMSADFLIRMLPSSMLSLVAPGAVAENPVMMSILEWGPILPWVAIIMGLIHSFGSRTLPTTISRKEYIETLERTGAGSLGWASTWEGNEYWGSPEHDAAIAYRPAGRVALTVTQPAAFEKDMRGVLKEFTDFCVEQDLIPAFYLVHAPVAQIVREWGWHRRQVGEEVTLSLSDLNITGDNPRQVPSVIAEAEASGIEAKWVTWASCSSTCRDQIRQLSKQWAGDEPVPELEFTLGRLQQLDDPQVRILLAVDKDDNVQAVTSWLPIYKDGEINGWTLDMARQDSNGLHFGTEFLIAKAALWGAQGGYETLSLSAVPLADTGMGERAGSSHQYLDTILELVGETLEPAYRPRSLPNLQPQFQPEYQPLYLAVPDLAALPAVGVAIGHAYLPDLSIMDAAGVVRSLGKDQQ